MFSGNKCSQNNNSGENAVIKKLSDSVVGKDERTAEGGRDMVRDELRVKDGRADG